MKDSNEAPKRHRSVLLDSAKVRTAAARIGITSEATLDTRFRSFHDISNGQEITVIHKAWHGGRVDRKPATKLAQCLGLPDFIPLLADGFGENAWSGLLTDAALRNPFLRFTPESNDTRLVRLGQARQTDELPRVPVDTRWCIDLAGHRGDSVFLLLRSESRFFQLAPLNEPTFVNQFDSRRLRYPETDWMEFNPDDGLGWRELIAIRADLIPIPVRNHITGYETSFEELELFARRLRNHGPGDEIAVDTYAFMLTEPTPP